ncbi:MAG TPA: GNAT family N-acetyltransferase [Candidatus Limnocylindrales bacterium]|nr:GNAT family N-acetyltransferase [Candidatus Limnocylindrales bacterium]
MAVTVERLHGDHVEDAARLAAAAYRDLRRALPILPAAWESPDATAPLIMRIIDAGPAFAAVERGRLVGYLAGWIGAGRGLRWSFSPEWANAAAGDDPRLVREALYSAIAGEWLDAGAPRHLVSTMATAAEAIETWSWLGFGVDTVDAIRDLSPTVMPERSQDPPPDSAAPTALAARMHVRRAGVDDVAAVARLERGLRDHLAAPPVLFALGPARTNADHERLLADPAIATFVAEASGTGAVAYLRIGPVADDVAAAVRDPSTAAISGAFTIESRRRGGVATALLDAALAWARSEGRERCSVDFESRNVLARRFWLRWFRPAVLTVGRSVDRPAT